MSDEKKDSGCLFLLILILLGGFLKPSVGFQFILLAHMDADEFSSVEKVGVSLMTSRELRKATREFKDLDKGLFSKYAREAIIDEFIPYNYEEGASYRSDLIYNNNFRVRYPGILSGIKNGFISVMNPIFKLITSPIKIIVLIYNGEISDMLMILWRDFKYSFFQFYYLFFGNGGLLYKISYIFGVLLGFSCLGMGAGNT